MAKDQMADIDFFYAMSRTPAEADRLHRQAVLWQKATGAILDQLEISEGMSCLDFGCGSGDVMLELGKRVGPNGHVCGLDTDAELCRKVVEKLNKKQISTFSFHEADVNDPAALPDRTFDVTSARFFMLHMPDPLSTLKAIWRLTKPGGVMVVIDYDFRTHGTVPPCPEMEEFISVVDGVFEKSGLDPRRSCKLPHYFEKAGIGPPDDTDVFGFIKPVIDIRDFMLLAYRGLLPAALKLGVTTEDKSNEFMAYLEGMTEKNRTYWLSALYIGMWKRKENHKEGKNEDL
jgi:SAM-dependent methyltransferase